MNPAPYRDARISQILTGATRETRYEIPAFEEFVGWAKKQPKRQLEATD